MKSLKLACAAALAVAGFTAGTANARPGWAPPHEWGPGWQRWQGRNYGHGWAGPAYFAGPGEHHGWYHWHDSWYENCGWRLRHRVREWNCY
jgi:hypothetical protein